MHATDVKQQLKEMLVSELECFGGTEVEGCNKCRKFTNISFDCQVYIFKPGTLGIK